MSARPKLAALPWEAVCAEGADGHDAPPDDRYRVEACSGEGAAAYGEIPVESATRLLGWLRPAPSDVLFDLGCGTGKFCLQAMCTSQLGAAHGVELSSYRYAGAEARRTALLELMSAPDAAWLRPRLTFVREDLRRVDLSQATIVYAGATAYPDALLDDLAEKVSRAPLLRLLITTRPLPPAGAARFAERGRFRLPMSWAEHERASVYEPRRAAPWRRAE